MQNRHSTMLRLSAVEVRKRLCFSFNVNKCDVSEVFSQYLESFTVWRQSLTLWKGFFDHSASPDFFFLSTLFHFIEIFVH